MKDEEKSDKAMARVLRGLWIVIFAVVWTGLGALIGCDWYDKEVQPVICPECALEGCDTVDLIEELVDRGSAVWEP